MMESKWVWFMRMAVMSALLLLEGCRWCTTNACLEQERIALLHLKPFFNNHYNDLSSWDEVKNLDCCEWKGVECNTTTKRLIGLSLHSEGWFLGEKLKDRYLSASLFLPFVELKSLDLSGNAIAGSVENEGHGGRKFKLTHLEELNLDRNLFNSSVFASLNKLSNLKYLSISGNQLKGSIDTKDLDAFINLRELDMSYNELKDFVIHKENKGLKNLKVVYLDHVFTYGSIPLQNLVVVFSSVKTFYLQESYLNMTLTTQELNVSSNVEELYFDFSGLNTNILHGIGVFSSLKTLSLPHCQLIGSLPDQGWCDLRNLEVLDVSWNALEGMLPHCFSNLTSLRELYISGNHFQIPLSFAPFANLSNLKVLLGDENKMVMQPSFYTSVPKFQLKIISLSKCITSQQLNLELPTFLYYQYDLRYVELSLNNFSGTVPTWLLENNTKLEDLILMGNSFTGLLSLPSAHNSNVSLIDISQNKLQGQIPTNVCSSFPHLSLLFLSKNAFEGDIPPCLSGMKDLSILDLSNNQLSGRVPEELITKSSLTTLRLSNNNLSGHVLPMILHANGLSNLYLDGNNFSGEMANVDVSISQFPTSLREINLRNNKFYGNLPRWIGNVSFLERLVLSQNGFEGSIPMEFCNLNSLEFLDFSENNLFGSIPSCFNTLNIEQVHLHGNRLSGPLPIAFYNISSLVTLDLRGNNLTGSIPKWIGTLSSLSVLILKDNHFHGEVPIQLCKLYSLSIIDLSQNMFSGPIPFCLGNLSLPMKEKESLAGGFYLAFTEKDEPTAIAMRKLERGINPYYPTSYLEELIEFTTKNGFYPYKGNILRNMTGIDLSCNNLTGHIPPELGNLSEIHSLNLSHNKLTGVIPSSFSKLKQIESLDLSYNNLSGEIPNQLVEMISLEVFNVAYNNLSVVPKPIHHQRYQLYQKIQAKMVC
ncbi:hypothetical protein GOBAR_DD35793 [Gossypium barbadense]|nr:hypothetical protein GOBAR_DD35793 [Gossypium barbadense]